MLSEEQLLLADSIEDILRATPRLNYERVHDVYGQPPHQEPCITFRLKANSDAELEELALTIVSDALLVIVNGNAVTIEIEDWHQDPFADWLEYCCDVVVKLLRSDIKLKTTQSLFGRVQGCTLWLRDSGSWTQIGPTGHMPLGCLFASTLFSPMIFLGNTRTQVFSDWY